MKLTKALLLATLAEACKTLEPPQPPQQEVVSAERERFGKCVTNINGHGFCDEEDPKTCVSTSGQLVIDGQYVKETPSSQLYDKLATQCEAAYNKAVKELIVARKGAVECLIKLNELGQPEMCYDTTPASQNGATEETTCIDTTTGGLTIKGPNGGMSGLDIRSLSRTGLEKATAACESQLSALKQ